MKVSCVIFVYFLSFATYSFGKGILDEIGDAIDDNFIFGKYCTKIIIVVIG